MPALLQTSEISKRFGLKVALDAVDFGAEAGEIHALLGENGAGKTTLMSIIAGRLAPDSGRVKIDGRPMPYGAPAAARAAGVATVHQNLLLFEHFSVADNLRMGSPEPAPRAWRKAVELAAGLGFELRPAPSLEPLGIAERVRLEILRALMLQPRILILDEPTALLGPNELAGFMKMLTQLRAQGRAVILITHKLAQALAVADRITVLRAGRVIARTRPSETSAGELAHLMIDAPRATPRSAAPGGAPLLQARQVSVKIQRRLALDGLDFELRAGEIVGVAGVEGNGQRELVELLAGHHRPAAGQLLLRGERLNRRGTELGVVPEDRDREGLLLEMELWENLLLLKGLRQRLSRLAFVRRRAALGLCAQLLERFGINASGPRMRAQALSGGHRQRLVLARALAAQPCALIVHNVTRGLDVGAVAEAHRMLGEFAAAGGAVLFISSDLDELLALCDRILVLNRGRLVEAVLGAAAPAALEMLMAGSQH